VSTKYKAAIYYALAAGGAVAALLFRDVLGSAFGTHYPYHTTWLAIIFAAWYCGIGPSILAVAIDALGIWYWFLPPYESFTGKNHIEYFGMAGYLVFSGVIVGFGESNRRLLIKRERAEEALQKANEQLEQRVRERTADLERLSESARRLSARVLVVQDEERRRIGRALHDSLGQYLAALKINLDELQAQDGSEASLASECSDLVSQCLTETRTISHLLHPPLLDEMGFCSATRLFVDGFSRRSGLNVKLDLPPDSATRLAPNLEIALFRAVQEGLTNIHRYAEATSVNVNVTSDSASVRLTISDNGKGMPAPLLKQIREGTAESGVGIAGMRERLREFNGALEIQSGDSGTTLTITTPAIVRASGENAFPTSPTDSQRALYPNTIL
jgi:signal transduction histidine kinase